MAVWFMVNKEVAQHRARLLLGWVTNVCWQINHLVMYPTTYVGYVNSAFHPSGVVKSSTSLYGWWG